MKLKSVKAWKKVFNVTTTATLSAVLISAVVALSIAVTTTASGRAD